MAIDYHRALALDIPSVEHHYTERDTMLYALGLGLGEDPMDVGALRYVYEKELKAFPTMPVALAFISLRAIPLGIDYTKMVHGGQSLTLHAPWPVAGTIVGKTRVTEIVDRGPGKGALIYLEREMCEKASGTLLATAGMSAFCRADGGFGGPVSEGPKPHPTPERPADLSVDVTTLPQQALIYRLSGDLNPLHADPEVARKAGFERPILHGLATYGVVARAIVAGVLGHDGDRLRSLTGRFSAPVFPGETLRVELWCEGEERVSVRATALQRGTVVFTNGQATLRI